MLSPSTHERAAADLTLVPVLTTAHWQQKLDLHQAALKGPDGHTNDANDWVEMERRKCQTGFMSSYLIIQNHQVAGSVGTMDHGDWLRLKNLVIHPHWRRQGVGGKTVMLVEQLAAACGKQRVGCFALTGGGGERVYRKAGFIPVGHQTEWFRTLNSQKEHRS